MTELTLCAKKAKGLIHEDTVEDLDCKLDMTAVTRTTARVETTCCASLAECGSESRIVEATRGWVEEFVEGLGAYDLLYGESLHIFRCKDAEADAFNSGCYGLRDVHFVRSSSCVFIFCLEPYQRMQVE